MRWAPWSWQWPTAPFAAISLNAESPKSLHADIRAMWQRYDYAYHADTTRPLNADIVSPALAEFLVEHFVVWGDVPRWRSKLDLLRGYGCDGIMFILGQGDAEQACEAIGSRLRELGELP